MSARYKTRAQRKKQIVIYAVAAAVLVLIVGFIVGHGIWVNSDKDKAAADSPAAQTAQTDGEGKNPVATITMQDGKQIVLELYPDKAPNTVANFVELANSGFYDGLIFHRVIKNFVIQGGDPTGTGSGGPGYSIKGEFSKNGFTKNDIAHERGVISMARSNQYDSAGSQFFIVHQDSPHLNNVYAAFGRVTSGLETVDAIASTPTNAQDRPLTEQVIKSIRVETFGVEYKAEKIK